MTSPSKPPARARVPPRRPSTPRSTSRRRLATVGALVSVVLLVALVTATLRLFVFPTIDEPRPADAIFMLEGDGDRRALAFELARAGYAPVLVVSTPGAKRCPTGEVAGVELICFRPDPSTTQGEAREAARLAAQHDWQRVIFVTDRSQDTRARLRIGRCYDGEVLVTTVDPRTREWPRLIAYQWGALAKALIWQRDC